MIKRQHTENARCHYQKTTHRKNTRLPMCIIELADVDKNCDQILLKLLSSINSLIGRNGDGNVKLIHYRHGH